MPTDTPAVTPETLTVGQPYRALRPFAAGAVSVAAGDVLRFEERIYNREDTSWLYRFRHHTQGDAWLIEADPRAIDTLRQLSRFLAEA